MASHYLTQSRVALGKEVMSLAVYFVVGFNNSEDVAQGVHTRVNCCDDGWISSADDNVAEFWLLGSSLRRLARRLRLSELTPRESFYHIFGAVIGAGFGEQWTNWRILAA